MKTLVKEALTRTMPLRLRTGALWSLPATVAAAALVATAMPALAADPCQGIRHCQNLGPFTATVTKVNVTRQDTVTAYQGVHTTVRFTNNSAQPIVLAYRDKTSAVSDNNGLAYRWSSKATGIGLVSRGVADPQFRLAPGESREASFDGVVQYSMRRQVAGNVFQHDITIVQLAQVGPQQIREVRDYAVSFSQLTATSGFAGAAAAPSAGPMVAMPSTASTPPSATRPGGESMPADAGGGAGPMGAAPAAAPAMPNPAATAGCGGAMACQVQGPVQAAVVRVNVTDSGGVTAYHTVRTTVRFTNVGNQPLILGYRDKTGAVSDNNGLAYRWSSKAMGIGVVSANGADPQFRLAPGESREAAFESTLQYNTRRQTAGRVFQHDMTIALLQVVGPSQVRTTSDLAFSFSNLSAGGVGGASFAGSPGAANPQAAEAAGKVVELFKALKK